MLSRAIQCSGYQYVTYGENGERKAFCVKWGQNEDHFSLKSSIEDLNESTACILKWLIFLQIRLIFDKICSLKGQGSTINHWNILFLSAESSLPISRIFSSYQQNCLFLSAESPLPISGVAFRFFPLVESVLPIGGIVFSLVCAWAVTVAGFFCIH